MTMTKISARKTCYTLVARAIRNAIRANRFARIIRNSNPYFYSASGRFARITRISDSRESPDSRESCESICANHATKCYTYGHGHLINLHHETPRASEKALQELLQSGGWLRKIVIPCS